MGDSAKVLRLPIPCPGRSLRALAGCAEDATGMCTSPIACLNNKAARNAAKGAKVEQLFEVANLLETASWAQRVQRSTLEALLRNGRPRRMVRGEVIARSGAAARNLILVVSGAIEVSMMSPGARRRIAAYLGPGEIFNIVPFMDWDGSLHDAIAQSDMLVLMLDRAVVEDAMANDSMLGLILMEMVAKRARLFYRVLAEHSLLSPRDRCVRTLLHLAAKFGVVMPDGNVDITLRLSQEELADVVGCSRQKLNVQLKQLERDGFISLAYAQVSISNEPGLLALVVEGRK
ncbi:Crp/Fnr family transcriptional regulator [Dyella halodurans]|uniref:CRP-like protein Clp n=1 Tax=Dyella halodurans TaxID=1920171 RepID=A0ABV9C2U7_9GAMM|nr:Crp/Fnr family transcriptional regulator [Dyella halodurans]